MNEMIPQPSLQTLAFFPCPIVCSIGDAFHWDSYLNYWAFHFHDFQLRQLRVFFFFFFRISVKFLMEVIVFLVHVTDFFLQVLSWLSYLICLFIWTFFEVIDHYKTRHLNYMAFWYLCIQLLKNFKLLEVLYCFAFS